MSDRRIGSTPIFTSPWAGPMPNGQSSPIEWYVNTTAHTLAGDEVYNSQVNVKGHGLSGPVLFSMHYVIPPAGNSVTMELLLSKDSIATNIFIEHFTSETYASNQCFLFWDFLQTERYGNWNLRTLNREADEFTQVKWGLVLVPGGLANVGNFGGGGSGGGGLTTATFSFSTDGFLDVFDPRDGTWRSIALLETGMAGGGTDVTPTFGFSPAGFMSVFDTRDSRFRFMSLMETGTTGGATLNPQFQFNTAGFLDVFDARDTTWKTIPLIEI